MYVGFIRVSDNFHFLTPKVRQVRHLAWLTKLFCLAWLNYATLSAYVNRENPCLHTVCRLFATVRQLDSFFYVHLAELR